MNQTFVSSARVVFIQGEHILDVQILIDDLELFNHLPGKFERHGVKTLSNWPFFVTAILNEQAEAQSAYALERHQIETSIRETSSLDGQLPIFDLTTTANPSGTKAHKRKVDRTLAEIRRLHDELNCQLYARPTERPVIHSPGDAFQVLQAFLGPLDHEELWVLNLDTRNRVLNLVKLYQGSVNASQVRVSEVFRQAIMDNAPALIVAHNHPSGDPTPSPEDVSVTRSIIQAGKLLDIEVLDHVVIGADRFVSLKERGLGFGS
jgi:proteasome lid subunit RPN8/RPN11